MTRRETRKLMFAIYDKDARHYYAGMSDSPSPCKKRALRFESEHRAASELGVLQATGLWPLYKWEVVSII